MGPLAAGSRSPGPADVHAAGRRIGPHVRRTALVPSAWLSGLGRLPDRGSLGPTGRDTDVRLKLESTQVTGSFKARGAMNALLTIVQERNERAGSGPLPTVVTASAGNHGRAVAWAAEVLGLAAIVFTPKDAPRAKLDAIRGHGADLRAIAVDYDEAERLAKREARERGGRFISAYSHPAVIAGAGTIGVEILEDTPSVDLVAVPVGGGGLLAGIAIAIKTARPEVEVVGVEMEVSPAFRTSLAAGRITGVSVGRSLADGLVGNLDPESITFDLVRRNVDRIVPLGEGDLVAGLRALAREEALVAEGAGAAAVAAVANGAIDVRGRRAVIIVSGANIDTERIRQLGIGDVGLRID
jgi:threonine dehydratase